MMKLNGETLLEKAARQIEAAAAAELAELRAQLAQVTDAQQREAISDAALTLASSWADAALLVGYEMATNPARWLFQSTGEPE